MERFKRNFDQLASRNPNLSSLTIFNNVLLHYNYKEQEAVTAFNKFVDKSDYKGTPKDSVLGYSLTLIPTPKKALKIRT